MCSLFSSSKSVLYSLLVTPCTQIKKKYPDFLMFQARPSSNEFCAIVATRRVCVSDTWNSGGNAVYITGYSIKREEESPGECHIFFFIWNHPDSTLQKQMYTVGIGYRVTGYNDLPGIMLGLTKIKIKTSKMLSKYHYIQCISAVVIYRI